MRNGLLELSIVKGDSQAPARAVQADSEGRG
jgi:hypothetical protein